MLLKYSRHADEFAAAVDNAFVRIYRFDVDLHS